MNRPVRHLKTVIGTLALVAIGFTACVESSRDGAGPTGLNGFDSAPSLSLVTGSGFQLAITDDVAFPIRVRAVDGRGRPIQNAWVVYDVLVGEGSFSADSTLTTDQGFTEVLFKPLSIGTVVARARITVASGSSDEMVTFSVLNDPNLAAGFQRVGGDNQSGTVGTVLAQPFIVRITNPDGFPVDSFPVTFALSSPDSVATLLDPETGQENFQITVLTDQDGFARAFMRLGSRPGVYSATATALFGSEGQTVRSATFVGTAVLPAAAATRLVAIAGERQTVILGTADSTDPTLFTPFVNPEQPNPLVVQALDRFGNPVPGVQIFWNVTDGGGAMFTFSTFTDQNGITLNVVTGVTLGRNLIDAVAATTNRVTFVIEGISREKDEDQRPGPGESGPPKTE